jgi:hypothetical protein
MKDEDFFLKLRDDMLQTKQRRIQYQLAKITALGALMWAGILIVEKMQLALIFYVTPFIAISFDLFISGESFILKRMTSFIEYYKKKKNKKKKNIKDAEWSWEEFVKKNPDRLMLFANFSISLATFTGSFLILIYKSHSQGTSFWGWWNLTWVIIASIGLITPLLLNWWFRKKVWK